jgi:hypothetical protein
MNIVKYGDWEFDVDFAATQIVYSTISEGGAQTCTCTYCKNYIAQIDSIFPKDIIKLLSDLGIDYSKDYEVWQYAKLDNGLHQYGGCFHFIGSFRGESCQVKIDDNTYKLVLNEVAPNFSIGFSHPLYITQSFFNDSQAVVEVNFGFLAPWVIDEEESE